MYIRTCKHTYIQLTAPYDTLPRRFASRASNVQGIIYDPTVGSSQFFFFFFRNSPPITLSMNNRITLYSYYVQLSATPCRQLRTMVDNVMRPFFPISIGIINILILKCLKFAMTNCTGFWITWTGHF